MTPGPPACSTNRGLERTPSGRSGRDCESAANGCRGSFPPTTGPGRGGRSGGKRASRRDPQRWSGRRRPGHQKDRDDPRRRGSPADYRAATRWPVHGSRSSRRSPLATDTRSWTVRRACRGVNEAGADRRRADSPVEGGLTAARRFASSSDAKAFRWPGASHQPYETACADQATPPSAFVT
jgi:hypothetical protein